MLKSKIREKCKIETVKNPSHPTVQAIKITFDYLTPGEALTLHNALQEYTTISPVCADLLAYLNNAILVSGIKID